MTKQKYELSTAKLAAIVISTVIGSAITTSIALLRVANSDHFTIVALGGRVEAIEGSFVPRTEWDQQNGFFIFRLDRIEKKVDQLLEK